MTQPLDLSVTTDGRVLRVQIVNRSDSRLTIWSQECSWGWSTVSLLLARPERPDLWHELTATPIRWTRNGPFAVEVAGEDGVVFEFRAGRPVLAGIEATEGWRENSLLVRARLRIEETPEARDLGVFIGEAVSPPHRFEPPHEWLFGADAD